MTELKDFVALRRTREVEDLLQNAPNAFLLLTLIAMRARYEDAPSSTGLTKGQALIGDYKQCGLTEQKYRTAKKQLSAIGLATFKATNRGTIATLCDDRFFSISKNKDNEPANAEVTIQQRSGNDLATTNNLETKKLIHAGAREGSISDKGIRSELIRKLRAVRFCVKETAPDLVDGWLSKGIPPENLMEILTDAGLMGTSINEVTAQVVKIIQPKKPANDRPRSWTSDEFNSLYSIDPVKGNA